MSNRHAFQQYLGLLQLTHRISEQHLHAINNGPKQPTVADLEAQVKTGMSISLMDLAEAAHREKKKSVLEQLKSQPAQERPHKTAPKKSAEKEL